MKRLLISLLITIGLLIAFLIPLTELINWGFVADIAMFIHWPLFGVGFFGEWNGEVIFFLILWYGMVISLGALTTYYAIQAISGKN